MQVEFPSGENGSNSKEGASLVDGDDARKEDSDQSPLPPSNLDNRFGTNMCTSDMDKQMTGSEEGKTTTQQQQRRMRPWTRTSLPFDAERTPEIGDLQWQSWLI